MKSLVSAHCRVSRIGSCAFIFSRGGCSYDEDSGGSGNGAGSTEQVVKETTSPSACDGGDWKFSTEAFVNRMIAVIVSCNILSTADCRTLMYLGTEVGGLISRGNYVWTRHVLGPQLSP